jgi:hypothetical protein
VPVTLTRAVRDEWAVSLGACLGEEAEVHVMDVTCFAAQNADKRLSTLGTVLTILRTSETMASRHWLNLVDRE